MASPPSLVRWAHPRRLYEPKQQSDNAAQRQSDKAAKWQSGTVAQRHNGGTHPGAAPHNLAAAFHAAFRGAAYPIQPACFMSSRRRTCRTQLATQGALQLYACVRACVRFRREWALRQAYRRHHPWWHPRWHPRRWHPRRWHPRRRLSRQRCQQGAGAEAENASLSWQPLTIPGGGMPGGGIPYERTSGRICQILALAIHRVQFAQRKGAAVDTPPVACLAAACPA